MRWLGRRERTEPVVSKPDPVRPGKADRMKHDAVKPDPVPGPVTLDRVAVTTPRPPAPTPTPPVVTPPLLVFRPLPMSVEDAAEDLVAALSAQLIEQAGDEFEATWSLDDPAARVEELLEDARLAYGDAIGDRVEADAWPAMVDAAQELADRLRDDEDDPI